MSQLINSSEVCEYYQKSHSNSNINVDQDAQQIASISKQDGKIVKHLLAVQPKFKI